MTKATTTAPTMTRWQGRLPAASSVAGRYNALRLRPAHVHRAPGGPDSAPTRAPAHVPRRARTGIILARPDRADGGAPGSWVSGRGCGGGHVTRHDTRGPACRAIALPSQLPRAGPSLSLPEPLFLVRAHAPGVRD
jgi:hypothetical protein